jgi:cysteine desulfuration protein SufE
VPFPPALHRLIDEFAVLPWDLKLEYLADYAAHLPSPEQDGTDAPFLPVPECQTPLAYRVTVAPDDTVTLAFDVAAHAVTAHGFLGLLHAGLNGASRRDVLAIDSDILEALGLATELSAQRLDGLRAVVKRIQLTLAADATDTPR